MFQKQISIDTPIIRQNNHTINNVTIEITCDRWFTLSICKSPIVRGCQKFEFQIYLFIFYDTAPNSACIEVWILVCKNVDLFSCGCFVCNGSVSFFVSFFYMLEDKDGVLIDFAIFVFDFDGCLWFYCENVVKGWVNTPAKKC